MYFHDNNLEIVCEKFVNWTKFDTSWKYYCDFNVIFIFLCVVELHNICLNFTVSVQQTYNEYNVSIQQMLRLHGYADKP